MGTGKRFSVKYFHILGRLKKLNHLGLMKQKIDSLTDILSDILTKSR